MLQWETVDLIDLRYLFVYLFIFWCKEFIGRIMGGEGAENQWEARESDQVASIPRKGMWLKHHL